ncbi:MAG TPA: DUF5671 domain-containing protein [Candidatus Eisenbacteria bacterium]|jgi:hypothetical protein
MTTELREFVRDALAHGMPRGEIREKLLAAGWRPEEVETALGSFAEIESPVPVPRRRPYLSAREAFFYLVLFVTLYLTAINVGSVLFQLVNRAIPEVAGGASAWDRFSTEAARGAVAGILTAFPIFLFMSRLIGGAVARDPEKRASKIRKWLTYVTLFVSACVIIGDLTFLVTRVLSGELVLRVGLKVLVVFLIAGVIFTHYLSDLRREEERAQLGPPKPGWLARSAGAAVVASLVAGLFLVGSPRQERLRKIDAARVEDLIRISWAVGSYQREHRALPDSLGAVAGLPLGGVGSVADPVTGEPYGYRIVDSSRYELSATFDTVDSTLERTGVLTGESRFWRHGAGRWTYILASPPRAGEAPAEAAPRALRR